MIYNSLGVIKATVSVSFPSGGSTCGGKTQTSDHRLAIIASSPDSGTIKSGLGTKLGMMAVTLGPAPAGAQRFKGRAFINGTQYYVTSGTKSFSKNGLSFTSNGDLLVDTT